MTRRKVGLHNVNKKEQRECSWTWKTCKGLNAVLTCTLEKGSMTRMRFCSSRLSYNLARWVLMMGSSLSSALYSVRAWRKQTKALVIVWSAGIIYLTFLCVLHNTQPAEEAAAEWKLTFKEVLTFSKSANDRFLLAWATHFRASVWMETTTKKI